MTTATYRGVKYDVEQRHLNSLQLIKNQLEKAELRRQAQMNMTKKS